MVMVGLTVSDFLASALPSLRGGKSSFGGWCQGRIQIANVIQTTSSSN